MDVRGTLELGFLRTLVEDVDSAPQRVDGTGSDRDCREAIRTIFAATEGLVWIYREHTRTAVDLLELLTPMLDLAMREKAYVVTDKGKLIEQTRFIPLPTMIRFTTRVANETFGGLEVDFNDVGWTRLKDALVIRNRLMHPKYASDLSISAADVSIAKAGFFWLLDLAARGMKAANVALSSFNEDAREIVAQLKGNDPETLAEYQAAVEELNAQA